MAFSKSITIFGLECRRFLTLIWNTSVGFCTRWRTLKGREVLEICNFFFDNTVFQVYRVPSWVGHFLGPDFWLNDWLWNDYTIKVLRFFVKLNFDLENCVVFVLTKVMSNFCAPTQSYTLQWHWFVAAFKTASHIRGSWIGKKVVILTGCSTYIFDFSRAYNSENMHFQPHAFILKNCKQTAQKSK